MINPNIPEGKFFICDCQSEGMYVTRFADTQEFYFSFFNRGFAGRKLSWVNRLRYIFKVIKTGLPFEDEILLNDEKAKVLANYLLKQIK